MEKLPFYKLVIDENDDNDSGVNYVALVDAPATDKVWMAFNKHYQFKSSAPEKRIISGALMVANLPIYREDSQLGQYYVVFDKDTIFKIVKKYFRNGFTSNVNMMHNPKAKVEGVYMIESMVIDKQRGIVAPAGYGDLPDGSWFGSFRVDNDEVWSKFIKTGVFSGFSVEGLFQQQYMVDATSQTLETLHDRIVNLRKEMVKLLQVKNK